MTEATHILWNIRCSVKVFFILISWQYSHMLLSCTITYFWLIRVEKNHHRQVSSSYTPPSDSIQKQHLICIAQFVILMSTLISTRGNSKGNNVCFDANPQVELTETPMVLLLRFYRLDLLRSFGLMTRALVLWFGGFDAYKTFVIMSCHTVQQMCFFFPPPPPVDVWPF